MNSLRCLTNLAAKQKVMPDDHSKLVPLLPIPNRTVKRVSADDSADSRVKVGHRQAIYIEAPGQQAGRLHPAARCKRCVQRLHLMLCGESSAMQELDDEG